MKRYLFNLVALTAVFWAATSFALGIDGRNCSSCHTMHNSQGGAIVASGGPNEGLLLNDCVGCHTGTNTDSSDPYVMAADAVYGSTTLAGGNFYWVRTPGGTDNKGHNVTGISGDDGTHDFVPPGGSDLAARMTCAGLTTGCHGNRATAGEVADMSGAHHGNAAGKLNTSTTVANSYRFLKGVKGYEDADWEFPPVTSSDHNEYYGVDRDNEGDSVTASISNLCAECHGDFHNGADSLGVVSGTTMQSPWIRHPIDFDMNNASGDDYSGISTTFNTTVPLGRGGTPWNSLSGAVATVMTADDDAIVTCITCHRAHGSPYDSMMRWNYKAWPGAGEAGCQYCHTTKQ